MKKNIIYFVLSIMITASFSASSVSAFSEEEYNELKEQLGDLDNSPSLSACAAEYAKGNSDARVALINIYNAQVQIDSIAKARSKAMTEFKSQQELYNSMKQVNLENYSILIKAMDNLLSGKKYCEKLIKAKGNLDGNT